MLEFSEEFFKSSPDQGRLNSLWFEATNDRKIPGFIVIPSPGISYDTVNATRFVSNLPGVTVDSTQSSAGGQRVYNTLNFPGTPTSDADRVRFETIKAKGTMDDLAQRFSLMGSDRYSSPTRK